MSNHDASVREAIAGAIALIMIIVITVFATLYFSGYYDRAQRAEYVRKHHNASCRYYDPKKSTTPDAPDCKICGGRNSPDFRDPALDNLNPR